MSNIYLLNPYFLTLIPIFILCELLCKRKNSALYFSNTTYLKNIKQPISLIDFYKYIAISSLILAICSPISTNSFKTDTIDALPFVISIDASESMEYDFNDEITKNSKFNISKKIALEFIDKRKDDKIALVLFGDYPYIASTLTSDTKLLKEILFQTKVNIAGTSFTTAYDAIVLSALSLNTIKANSKSIILITDGVDRGSSISFIKMKNMILKDKINLYTIIISQNELSYELKDLSYKSGGEFYIAKNIKDIKMIFSKIDKLKKSKLSSKNITFTTHYFQFPLFVSFIAFLLFLYQQNKRLVL